MGRPQARQACSGPRPAARAPHHRRAAARHGVFVLGLLGLLGAGCAGQPNLPSIRESALGQLVPGQTTPAEAQRLLGQPRFAASRHTSGSQVFTVIAGVDYVLACLYPTPTSEGRCSRDPTPPAGFVLESISQGYEFNTVPAAGPYAGRAAMLDLGLHYDGTGRLSQRTVGLRPAPTALQRMVGRPRLL